MGMSRMSVSRALAAVSLSTASVVLVACGHRDQPARGAGAPLSEAQFVARADRICLDAASHFSELPKPVGGAKPVGLGTFMRAWVAKLRVLEPPRSIEADWRAGLGLLVRAANRLDDAEAGDPDAQGDALWNLEARAQRRFDAMRLPFRACFVE